MPIKTQRINLQLHISSLIVLIVFRFRLATMPSKKTAQKIAKTHAEPHQDISKLRAQICRKSNMIFQLQRERVKGQLKSLEKVLQRKRKVQFQEDKNQTHQFEPWIEKFEERKAKNWEDQQFKPSK